MMIIIAIIRRSFYNVYRHEGRLYRSSLGIRTAYPVVRRCAEQWDSREATWSHADSQSYTRPAAAYSRQRVPTNTQHTANQAAEPWYIQVGSGQMSDKIKYFGLVTIRNVSIWLTIQYNTIQYFWPADCCFLSNILPTFLMHSVRASALDTLLSLAHDAI